MPPVKTEPATPRTASGAKTQVKVEQTSPPSTPSGALPQVKTEPATPRTASGVKTQVKVEPTSPPSTPSGELLQVKTEPSSSHKACNVADEILSSDDANGLKGGHWMSDAKNPSDNVDTVTKECSDSAQPTLEEAGKIGDIKNEVEDIDSDNNEDGSLQLCEGVIIERRYRDMIWEIPAGFKRDLRFIKDLAMAAFGPEVLARSSIKGTLKGKKKNSDNPGRREALNPTILDAVQDKVIERVAKELDLKHTDAEKHERCSTARYHAALRDLQKRCRALGYGLGKAPNTMDDFLKRNINIKTEAALAKIVSP